MPPPPALPGGMEGVGFGFKGKGSGFRVEGGGKKSKPRVCLRV